MKKLHLVIMTAALMMLSGITNSYAQRRGRNPDARIENRVQKMKTDLNLTDDQTTKVREIMKDDQQQMQTLRQSGADAATMKAKRKELQQSTHEKMKTILTPEQLQKWQTIQKNRRQGMPPGPGPNPGQ